MKIKFGTDGWRAVIADEFTYENVRRVAEGTATYMIKKGMKKVVIGYDCRFQGKSFSGLVAGVMGSFGIQVVMHNDGFVTTPMVSLAVKELKTDLGIVITASHNPPEYNGYKLKSSIGGPSLPSDVAAVEGMIPDHPTVPVMSIQAMQQNNLIEIEDLEKMYIEKVHSSFNLEAIRDSGLKIAYDAMFGAGQKIIRRIFPGADLLHAEHNPGFQGKAPEPIDRNLQELSTLIKDNPGKYDAGLANDGDADRIGMYDENGRFVDSHHLLLLLLDYMCQYKKTQGKVIVTFSVTDKMKKLAELYNMEVEVTKIGFKHIAERMEDAKIIVAGEESGGIAVGGYIPERDGIWIGLVILEYMVKTGKSLTQLIDSIYDKVGSFTYDRNDLHISEEKKQNILHHLKNHPMRYFGDEKVEFEERLDGFKYTLSNGKWVMVRPSGTEPVLRVYAQAEDDKEVKNLLKTVHETLNGFE